MNGTFGEHNDDLGLDDLVPRKTQIMCGMRRPRTQPPEQEEQPVDKQDDNS